MKHYSGLYFILICLLFSCHPLELENEQYVRQTPIQSMSQSYNLILQMCMYVSFPKTL